MLHIVIAGLMAVIMLLAPGVKADDSAVQSEPPAAETTSQAGQESSRIEETEKKPDRYSYQIILEERGKPVDVRIKYALDKDGDGIFDEPAVDLVSPDGDVISMREDKTGFDSDVISSVIKRDKGQLDLILQSDLIGMWTVQTEYPISLKTLDPEEENITAEKSSTKTEESSAESRETSEESGISQEASKASGESSDASEPDGEVTQSPSPNILPLVLAAAAIAAIVAGFIVLNNVTAKKFGAKPKKEKKDKKQSGKEQKDPSDAGSKADPETKAPGGTSKDKPLTPEERKKKEEEEAVRQMKEIYLNRENFRVPEEKPKEEAKKPERKAPEKPVTREDVEKDTTIIRVTGEAEDEETEEKKPDTVKKSFFPDDRFGD